MEYRFFFLRLLRSSDTLARMHSSSLFLFMSALAWYAFSWHASRIERKGVVSSLSVSYYLHWLASL